MTTSVMVLSRGSVAYTIHSPQYGYSTEIRMALKIGSQRAGYRSPRPCFDRGAEWDQRVFLGDVSLDPAMQRQLVNFLRLDAQARGREFRLFTTRAFHPFGPDLCAYTRFPASVLEFNPGPVVQHPWLYTRSPIRLSLCRPVVSVLPPETWDGNGTFSIGPVHNLRFPPGFYDSGTGWGITNVGLSGGSVGVVDRGQSTDVWSTTVDVVASLSRAAKLVDYLTRVARGNEFSMVCGRGSYAFGADLANADGSGSYMVQLIDPTISVTHDALNRFNVKLKLECRLFGAAPSESSFSASDSSSSGSGSKSNSSSSVSGSLSSYSISSMSGSSDSNSNSLSSLPPAP